MHKSARFFSLLAASKYLAERGFGGPLSPNSLRFAIAEQRLRAVRSEGGPWVIAEADLEAFVQSESAPREPELSRATA